MSGARDRTPRIPWDTPIERRRPVGQRIKDILWAEPDENLVDALALQALDFDIEADTYRELYLLSLAHVHRLTKQNGELQDRLRDFMELARRS